ncbi:nucleoporin subcomplex protein binding to Pom34-domain-containing protein [Macrophomina phaseolina]|uniref:Nucleoporin NUP188 n=1 Tax=Macrophomina phaseolina TaxID=35725 RepID=A0ABQ8GAX6_9PEZI|nr:nucleoporin subcomplex protein binding to Pom34-domain-containing protein [Macrophomina phaseolina]
MAASSGDSVLFPPLDKCLSGEQQLLSWKDAFMALRNSKAGREDGALRDFLSHETNVALLSQPFQPFQPPNAQSKSAFETKTAAINVTPSDNGQYNIDEIKEDTKWLSAEAGIDELSALRIVLLEWQTRPATQLLAGFTEEETLSVQDAAGGANLGSSTFLPKSTILAATASGMGQNFAAFHSKESRQMRLLEAYLTERIHILKISDLLARLGSAPGRANGPSTIAAPAADAQPSWVEELGSKVFSSQKAGFLKDGTKALQSRFQNIATGSGWYKDVPGGNEEAEEMWGQAQLAEAINILLLLFTHLDSTSDLLPSDVVVDWFEVMAGCVFCKDIQLPFQSQQLLVPTLQLLIAMVTLEFINIRGLLAFIAAEGSNVTPSDGADGGAYVKNKFCIERVTTILLAMCQPGPTPASPAMFAWAIFALTVTTESEEISHERETQITQGSPDAPSSVVEKLHDYIKGVSTNEDDEEDIPVLLTKFSVDGARIYELVPEIALSITGTFSDGDRRDNPAARSNHYLEARMRLQLLWLVSAGTFTVEYSPELITSFLTVLSGSQDYCTLAEQSPKKTPDPVLEAFIAQGGMGILDQAKFRYPYETIPLLQFAKALCFGVETDEEGDLVTAKWLQNKGQFTHQLPTGFKDYVLIREDETPSSVQLREDMSLFWDRKTSKRPIADEESEGNEVVPINEMPADEIHFLPVGTEGIVLNPDSKPHVIAWNHKHSALRYLASYLSTLLVGNETVDTATEQPIAIEAASEYIGLLATLITAASKAAEARDADQRTDARLILEDASDGLSRNQDVISLIFDIFEQELERLRERPNNDGSLELLVNCLYFIHALVKVFPNRVWPFFTRSKLLDLEGTGGSLVEIVSGTEMVMGRYDFLLACAHLFKALADDSIKHAVSGKQEQKAMVRFSPLPAAGSASPEKITSKVLLSFTKTFTGVFESSPSWRFGAVNQKLELNQLTLEIFSNILRTVHGYDDETPNSASKLSSVLAPSADYLLEAFCSDSTNDISTHAILNVFFTGTKTLPIATAARLENLWRAQTTAAISFATTILQAGVLLERPTSYLEHQLFKAAPLLARLSIAHEDFKSSVMTLLEILVKSAARGEKEPPSLLGHLGPETAKAFLSVISTMSGSLKDTKVEVSIWRFLSAVVSSKQQWLSIYLLTGNTPRDSLKSNENKATGKPRGKPVLISALDQLCVIQSLEPRRAVAMLEFISLAQNHWPWAVTKMHSHKDFLVSIMDFIRTLQPVPASASLELVESQSIKVQMASLISDIGAMCLHYARQLGDMRPAQHVIAKLDYLKEHGVDPPAYNQSLHTNLKKNVESKFSDIKLSSFKRTILTRSEFGLDYFYDLHYASEVLGFHQTWVGLRKGDGFVDEFQRANANLSLVEAQIMLLKSWKLLATELSCIANKDHRLEEILSHVVEQCLRANQTSNGSQALFERLVHVRADTAFVLMQKLTAAGCQSEHIKALFRTCWDTVRLSGVDFEIAFMGDNADYYRTLLRILFLTLQPHIKAEREKEAPGIQKNIPAIVPELMEILEKVVATGLRSLANQVHEDQASCSPADFVLLSALLSAILRVPGMHIVASDVTILFANANTVRHATALFSWADQLTIDGDPIYGELSILFLLELSGILPMAEYLAVEGVLSRLSTANLVNYYRKNRGMGPYDNPPRLFSIWTRGILPLCLNLLDAVGAPVAGEVSAFLNQFPEQLARASAALNPRNAPSPKDPHAGSVSLGVASETHSLALIDVVLGRFRSDAAAAAGVNPADIMPLNWDRAGVKEDVEGWLQGRRSLRDRLVPTNERELELVRQKPIDAASGTDNKLEERVVAELTGALECLNDGAVTGGSGGGSGGGA